MSETKPSRRVQDALSFGEMVRDERKALGKTQAELAATLNLRRQTLVDLEAGKNVGLHFVFKVLAGLGKVVAVTDARPDVDSMRAMLGIDDEY